MGFVVILTCDRCQKERRYDDRYDRELADWASHGNESICPGCLIDREREELGVSCPRI